MFEVELKFSLADPGPVLERLKRLGAQPQPPVEQVDVYFNHPCRDFAQTDEALRIRSQGPQQVLTYKSALLDSRTKTRREIEIPLAAGESREKLAEALTLLGFTSVFEVRKRRQPQHLNWHDRDFEVAFDEVEGLGPFVEVETLANAAERPVATQAILDLAALLELSKPEPQSYLRLLLQKTPQKS
ncbi:MAG: class IV adenylate cyclase [Planctomycetes bacterium]|nr:class IV adenylate cyclase [Planctomycetota bacterium]